MSLFIYCLDLFILNIIHCTSCILQLVCAYIQIYVYISTHTHVCVCVLVLHVVFNRS